MSLLRVFENRPVIAAIRDLNKVQYALESDVDSIFIMNGNLKEVTTIVEQATAANKGTFIHLDLLKGLSSSSREAIEIVKDYIKADGIVTPKSYLVREAKEVGLYAILHLFILDTLSLKNALKMLEKIEPDAIELMPGPMGKVIRQFAEVMNHIPIIASGLIQTPEEVTSCLDAGATAVAVSESNLWYSPTNQRKEGKI